ncbi:MAG: acetate kinase [Bacteroidetes bacterium]|nr:acetate kinase [Bacteroidota bacterium]
MKILALNCGSSSVKYQLIDMANNADLLAKGLLDRVGTHESELKHEVKGKEAFICIQDIENHQEGINLILKVLTDPINGVIKHHCEIEAVGHRVAHGGENFNKSALINESVIADIDKCCELAPLHNPANLKGILSMQALLPHVPQVAVFDTSFHQTMPAHSYLYGIPYEYYTKYKVRRYGFHGTSHKYVAEKGCELMGLNWKKLKIITCHLGNGASITAIDHGKSVDTSMGFTPVEGLIMGTRAGDLDLGVLLFLMQRESLDLRKANDLINKQSGMKGISGISFDMRDLHKAAEQGNERAKIALDMYSYRVKKYIGAYAAAMGGVDAIIFAGGIGENDYITRAAICKGLEFIGIDFDFEKNICLRGKDEVLTKPESKTKVLVIQTNEELVIATDTMNLTKNIKVKIPA